MMGYSSVHLIKLAQLDASRVVRPRGRWLTLLIER
jgi:hypothetical protein